MRALALASLLLATHALAQSDAATRAAWNEPVEPFRMVGNVYYVGMAGVAAYLITTPEGHVLLDGGLPESAPRIEASIAKLGFKLSDVKVLLSSHAHFDHAGGLAELKRKTGARLAASKGDAPALQAGRGELLGPGSDGAFPAVQVDRLLDDGAEVRLGGSVLTAHVTAGHTRGCTTWTLPVVEEGKTRQVLFLCSTSAPGYKLIGNTVYPKIVEDYRRTFAALRKVPCDVFLAAHPSFFDLQEKRKRQLAGGPNPFIDPAEFRAFLDDSEHDFEAEVKKQSAAPR